MQVPPKLNFPTVDFRLRDDERGRQIWCETRRQWLVLTPEEWVRRHLVAYLVRACGVAALRVVEEYPVLLNGQAQRADVVVVDDAGQPLILAECKAPEVKIDRSVLDQAARYNAVLHARYLIVTNGLRHYCYELTDAGYCPKASFPTCGDL